MIKSKNLDLSWHCDWRHSWVVCWNLYNKHKVRSKTATKKLRHLLPTPPKQHWALQGQDWPDAVEDEEELDEDAAKGQHATHDDARQGAGVQRLVWDLAWDLVCAHWMLNGLATSQRTSSSFCHPLSPGQHHYHTITWIASLSPSHGSHHHHSITCTALSSFYPLDSTTTLSSGQHHHHSITWSASSLSPGRDHHQPITWIVSIL